VGIATSPPAARMRLAIFTEAASAEAISMVEILSNGGANAG